MPTATVPAIQDGAALRADGGLVLIRAVRPDDREALLQLDARASDRSIRNRFFSVNRVTADRYAESVAAEPVSARRDALIALIGEHPVALGTLEVLDRTSCELALMVVDAEQHVGIGTLLIESLVAAAQRRGLSTVIADVLADNTRMLGVLHDLGLPVRSHCADGVVHLQLDLSARDSYAAAVTERERQAELASLRPLRAPESIAVVGAGTRPGSVGRALLDNVLRLRLPGPRPRRQPAPRRGARRAVPAPLRGPARGARPGGDRGAGGPGARRRRRLRPARCAGGAAAEFRLRRDRRGRAGGAARAARRGALGTACGWSAPTAWVWSTPTRRYGSTPPSRRCR